MRIGGGIHSSGINPKISGGIQKSKKGGMEDESEEEEKDGKEGPTPKFGLAAGRQAAPFFRIFSQFFLFIFLSRKEEAGGPTLGLSRPRQAGRRSTPSTARHRIEQSRHAPSF